MAVSDDATPVAKVADTKEGPQVTLRDRALQALGLEDAEYIAFTQEGGEPVLQPVSADDVQTIEGTNYLAGEGPYAGRRDC